MNNRDKQVEIIKQLNDNRSKLSALFSLYNSSILVAENNRTELGSCYERMLDLKDDVNAVSGLIKSANKAEKSSVYQKNKTKIKHFGEEMKACSETFETNVLGFKVALKECGALKAEYKHTISELCKDFKATVDDDTDPVIIKGYKQQIRIIKAILDKIEEIVCDYNVKKNRMEEDNEKFVTLVGTVSAMLDSCKIA